MKKLTSNFLNITIVIICSISVAEAEHPRVEISKKDCIRLIRQIKTADVAYKPGINVRGQKILPADLSSRNTIKLPDVFEFNIAIDIRKYLGGPEDDAAASSAAVIAANKATSAENSAEIAATSAENLATVAETISTVAAANAVTADTVVTTSKTALDNDPLNKALRETWETAKLASGIANTLATEASSDAITITLAASKVRSAANSSVTATLTKDKSSYAEVAASEAKTTATLASAAAGSDNSKILLANAATIASQTAIMAANDANASTNANADLIAANRKVQKLTGLNMNVGKVSYNIKTGGLIFNGQSLTKDDQTSLKNACQEIIQSNR